MSNFHEIRIFLLGKNILEDIKFIKNDLKISKIDCDSMDIYFAVDQKTHWIYFIFQIEIIEFLKDKIYDEKTNKLLIELSNITLYKNLKNITEGSLQLGEYKSVFIISVDKLFDRESIIAFYAIQELSTIKNKQPFILFLTKSNDYQRFELLFPQIRNEYFDKRNLYSYKFPTTEEEKEKIDKFLIKCMNYYHELGNIDSNSQKHTFNILLCGPAGTGKSTFINHLFHEKVAKEGEGLSVTQKNTSYIHPIYPIKFIDTPGFENNETVINVKKSIDKYENDVRDPNEHLELILYFSNLRYRCFLNMEIDLIKYILEKGYKLIFILNDFSGSKNVEREKKIQIFKESLKKIINTIKFDSNTKIKEILDNIVVIKLLQTFEDIEDNDGKNVIEINQCYGMDELFHKIYQIYGNEIIYIHNLEDKNNLKELRENIKKFNLLSKVKNIFDNLVNIKIECCKLILSYSKKGFFNFFKKDKRIELLSEIRSINKGESIYFMEDKLSEIDQKIGEINNKEDFIIEFFDSMRRFKGIYDTEGFDFDNTSYDKHTLLLGYLQFKEFESIYGYYDDKTKKFILELSKSYNNAINDFEKISAEWKKVYKHLNYKYSSEDWIKKFFHLSKLNDNTKK